MVDLCIADGTGEVDLFHRVAKPEGSCLRVYLIAAAGFECMVVARFGFLQLAEDLLQAFTADAPFGL